MPKCSGCGEEFEGYKRFPHVDVCLSCMDRHEAISLVEAYVKGDFDESESSSSEDKNEGTG